MRDLLRLKKAVKTYAILALITYCSFNLKAQDDKISGIYVDGVKVTEIDCYSFSEMEYIFPIDKLKGFDLVYVDLTRRIDGSTHGGEFKDFNQTVLNLNTFKYGGQSYAKVKLYTKGKDLCAFRYGDLNDPYSHEIDRNEVYVRKDETKKFEFYFVVGGKSITGYKEEFDAGCNCIKKTPVFNSTNVYNCKLDLKPNTNGNTEPEKPKGIKAKLVGEKPVVIDYGLACNYKGQKLEDLLKSGSQSNVASNNVTQAINNTAAAKTNTKPHTEKHKNGKIAVQGQFDSNGQHEGTWKYFTEAGKVERVENYKGGIMHGEWKYYDEAGKLTKTEKYNEGELIE